LTHTFNRTEICNFSGIKIHPGHGKRYVRIDNRVSLLASRFSARLD